MDENKKKFNWKSVVIIVMAGLLIFCLAKINDLEDDVSNFQNKISGYQDKVSDLQNEIDAIYKNVDEQLKKEASLLSSVSYTLGEMDTETHLVDVTVKVVPKSLSDDMQLSLKLSDTTASFERNGNEFTATFPVNMFVAFNEYPMLSINSAGTTKTEMLESVDLTTLYTRYLPTVYAYITPFDEFRNGKLEIDGNLQFDAKSTAIDSDVTIVSVELVTEKNQKEIARTNVTDKVDADYNHVPVKASYEVSYGDELCIYVLAKDSLGYTHKTLSYYWYKVDEHTDQAIADIGGHTEIYDKDGNLLTGGY